MTTQPNNDPIPPFRVQSELLKNRSDAAANGSAGSASGGGDGRGSRSGPVPGFDWNRTQIIAAPLLLLIFYVTQQVKALVPVTIFVLLAAVLFRLDERRRQIAAVPLTLAALRLAGNLVAVCRGSWQSFIQHPGQPAALNAVSCGLSWVPLFLAISLIYMPRTPTATGKIFLGASLLILAAGLLPIEGALGILATCQYFMFIGVVVGLLVDFVSPRCLQPEPTAPLEAAPLGATR